MVYESDDQAGIDVWGSPILRGNVIRYNFWHPVGSGRDVAGQSGIRLDDMISNFVVYGNVFYRAAGGRFGAVQIHGGKDNAVDNNLFVDCARLKLRDRGVNLWLDNLQLCDDPRFADPARRDFTLPDDSPVYDRFGFRPIPFGEIGLYQDDNRATWPVEQEISPHYVAE